jgi:hypothetical protein
MRIKNIRKESDGAILEGSKWSGILVGSDGYPTKK